MLYKLHSGCVSCSLLLLYPRSTSAWQPWFDGAVAKLRRDRQKLCSFSVRARLWAARGSHPTFCRSLSPNPPRLKEKLLTLPLNPYNFLKTPQNPAFFWNRGKTPEIFITAVVLDSGFEGFFNFHTDRNSRKHEKDVQPSTSHGTCCLKIQCCVTS